ncbi:MAG: glycosyl transferase family 1 [Gemmatimonadetes bacterium]|nr:glycosyl transferase family 1 [Gemmatimonadota bacterium]
MSTHPEPLFDGERHGSPPLPVVQAARRHLRVAGASADAGAGADRPLRLLYVSHSFPPEGRLLDNLGGMQRVATELHDALAAHPGVRLTSRVLRSTSAATPFRIGPFLAGLLVELPRLVARERIDAVLFSSPVTAALALPLRPFLAAHGVRLATIAYGLDVTSPLPVWRSIARGALRAMDDVFAISRATAEACIARGAQADRVRVVPCGIDTRRFPAVQDRRAERRALLASLSTGDAGPIADGALLLAGVGRHVRRKGFAWMVDAVMPLLPADVVFLLAGEGPETGAVREAVARRGLAGRVRLLGRVSDADLARLYRGADLFVMPNVPVAGDMEGFGVVILEAGLSGLPTVGTALEGIRDAVTEGENGDLVPAGDARAFADAVLRFHRDRPLLAERSARARRFVAPRFEWGDVADRFVRALGEAQGARAQPAGRSGGGSLSVSSPQRMP